MHTSVIRSPQPLAILEHRTPWRYRIRSMLSTIRHRRNEESKHESLYRLADRVLADVGLYREHRIHHPQNRTDQQQVSPVPVALLAMWMPRI
jgi:hypothetical protein